MKPNYYSIHKNKKPKKPKYSKLFSRLEYAEFQKTMSYFLEEIEVMKRKKV